MRRLRVALLPLILLPACTPIVAHGPRPEPGWRFGGTIGATASRTTSRFRASFNPVALAAHRGYFPEGEEATAYGFAAALPIGILPSALNDPEFLLWAVQVDSYASFAPTEGGAHRAAGISLSRHHLMPYAQYGRRANDGSDWYTTHGLAVIGDLAVDDQNDLLFLWMPGLAFHDGRGEVHFQISGGVGARRVPEWRETRQTYRSEFAWMAIGSFVLLLGGDESPAPPPAPPDSVGARPASAYAGGPKR